MGDGWTNIKEKSEEVVKALKVTKLWEEIKDDKEIRAIIVNYTRNAAELAIRYSLADTEEKIRLKQNVPYLKNTLTSLRAYEEATITNHVIDLVKGTLPLLGKVITSLLA